MKTNLYYDLSGGVDNSAAKTVSENSKKVKWLKSSNIEIYKNTGIQRMNGNTALLDTPLEEKIHSLGEYVKGDRHYLVCATDAGKFYLYDSANSCFILKKSGLATNKKMNFISYNNGLVCSNGEDEPFFFELGADEEIKSCSATDSTNKEIRGNAIAVFKGRVWIADESTLYYSALGKFDDWQTAEDAGYISNFHNDSSKISALKNYNDFLAIYKEDKTYLLSGSSPDNFSISLFADRGTSSINGAANVQNKQFFLNNGVFALEMTGELCQVNLSQNLAVNIMNELKEIDKSRLSEICIIPYSKNNQIWFFVPVLGKVHLNTVWIYDFNLNAWFKRDIPQEITCATNLDGTIITADTNGQIYLEDNGSTFNGEPITFYWQTYFFTFGNPNIAKTVDEVFISLDETKQNTFNIRFLKDFATFETTDEQQIESKQHLGLVWDEGYWADDEHKTIWTPDSERFEKIVISGANRGVSFIIEGTKTKDNIALLGIEFRDIYLES